MELTVINSTDGSMHVHKKGCADIQRRELANANGWFVTAAENRRDAVADIWQDFIGEDDDIDCYMHDTVFYPCCKL